MIDSYMCSFVNLKSYKFKIRETTWKDYLSDYKLFKKSVHFYFEESSDLESGSVVMK